MFVILTCSCFPDKKCCLSCHEDEELGYYGEERNEIPEYVKRKFNIDGYVATCICNQPEEKEIEKAIEYYLSNHNAPLV